jgi:hypothetical protein
MDGILSTFKDFYYENVQTHTQENQSGKINPHIVQQMTSHSSLHNRLFFFPPTPTVAGREGGGREVMNATVKQRQTGVGEGHQETREGSPRPRD